MQIDNCIKNMKYLLIEKPEMHARKGKNEMCSDVATQRRVWRAKLTAPKTKRLRHINLFSFVDCDGMDRRKRVSIATHLIGKRNMTTWPMNSIAHRSVSDRKLS